MSRVASAKVLKSGSIKSTPRRSITRSTNTDREKLFPCANTKIRPKTASKIFDLERAQSAHVITKQERLKLQENREAEIQKLELESQNRKRSLQELDAIRDEKLLSDQDIFAEGKAERDAKLLDQALWAKHEQEDEVKRANKIILAAKVHVLQDAQINEKRLLERQLREKEKRLEQIMLEDDAKKLAEEKRKEQEQKNIRDQYANELKAGLKNREMKKILEAERIENEAQAIALAQLAIKQEEEAKKREKQERLNQIKQDLQQTIIVSEQLKKKAEEKKRAAEMKAQEYMRLKAEREKQLEMERKLEREQKQKEIDRILTRQQQMLKTKQETETANLRRIQEQKEREFRKNAIETASKRKEMEEQVLQARAAQIEETKRIRAKIEEQEAIERQKQMNKLKEDAEKEKANKEKMYKLKEQYRTEIITQIKQKVENHQVSKLQSRQELEKGRKAEETRKENVRKVIASKVAEMRESNIPEHIIRDVERQLNLIDN